MEKPIFGEIRVIDGKLDPDFVEALNDAFSARINNDDIEKRNLSLRAIKSRTFIANIGESETAIGHGLGTIPQWYDVQIDSVKSDWKITRLPTTTHIYLSAFKATTALIRVEA